MAWYIASIPLWMLTSLFLTGAIVAGPARKPDETSAEIAGQIVFGLIMSTLCGSIAAWMVS